MLLRVDTYLGMVYVVSMYFGVLLSFGKSPIPCPIRIVGFQDVYTLKFGQLLGSFSFFQPQTSDFGSDRSVLCTTAP